MKNIFIVLLVILLHSISYATEPGGIVSSGTVTNPVAGQVLTSTPATPNPGPGYSGIWYWYKVWGFNYTAAPVQFSMQYYTGTTVLSTTVFNVPANDNRAVDSGIKVPMPIGYSIRCAMTSTVTGTVNTMIEYEQGFAY